CHGRLRGAALAQMRAALLEQVVGALAHRFKYGKFSSTKSSGSVKSRVFPISTPAILSPASSAERKAFVSSYGGRSRQSRSSTGRSSAQSGAAESGLPGSSSTTRSTQP